jgi:molybdenum-dependent DNA-binding transcriptional regulator ModE
MPVHTKYTEKRVEQILKAIRETGSVKTAWKLAGIDKTTYYRWLTAHPPLVASVAEAQDDFQRNLSSELKESALKALTNYINGRTKVTNAYENERTEDVIGEDGTKSGIKTIVEKKKVTTTMPPPQWAIERILGKPLLLGDAIAAFVSYGYKVEQTPTGYILTDLRAAGNDDGSRPVAEG